MRHIFIIGSKGIPANYGGYETFVENLTKRKINNEIKYHVACMSDNNEEFEYNGANCFNVKIPNLGAAKAVIYDIYALKRIIKKIKNDKISNAVVLILACRIGIVIKKYVKKLHNLGVKVMINPDGHEWKRSKWPWIIKKYWKYSERKMVKYSDKIICDSLNIEKYIHSEYSKCKLNTCYIAYGADITQYDINEDIKFKNWSDKFNIKSNQYYLIVGRFVPENNYELIINEFMKSKTNKDLVIITNFTNNKYYDKLLKKTKFNTDKRIKFVGTVYDQELLIKIRCLAYAYIHGHSVGGTNPSLLEGLGSTRINLLYDVPFNHEVGLEAALYFKSDSNNLSKLINKIDLFSEEECNDYSYKAKDRIKNGFSWNLICSEYEEVLLNG